MKRTSDFLKNLQKISEFPRIAINHLQPHPGSRKKKRVKGRGPASRRGKTAGRGHKGQGQRSNAKYRKFGFEGGAVPFYRIVPQRLSSKRNLPKIVVLNLNKIQRWVDMGRLDLDKPITLPVLRESGLIPNVKDGVKLLGDGADWFEAKINIEVSRASKVAIEKVEQNGGSVLCKYYGKVALRYLLHPEKFLERQIPRNPIPRGPLLAYYLNPAKRGYLAITEEGKERLAQSGLSRIYLNEEGRAVLRPEVKEVDKSENVNETKKLSQELD